MNNTKNVALPNTIVITLMPFDDNLSRFNIWQNCDLVYNLDMFVSYTRACETSAGCLRSIYPSLGMRRDVTMGRWRHNQPTELSDLIIQ